MEVQDVRMKEGEDETGYAKNSLLQKNIILFSWKIVKQAILDLYCTTFQERLNIADLGCSTGPNALFAISEIMDVVDKKRFELGYNPMQFQCFLNDLPWNDFNTVFKALPEFHKKRVEKDPKGSPSFIVGVPDSFYGRLFPDRSLDFVISSSSLHWLSQVPNGLESNAKIHLNRGNINISKTSPPCVLKCYSEQFQRDFSTFITSRSEEIVIGGRMVLTIISRNPDDPTEEENSYAWDCLANALMDMSLEGLIEEERIDSYNMPLYHPSLGEVLNVIHEDGTFNVDRHEIIEVKDSDVSEDHQLANILRPVVEPILADHFGTEIMDDLFSRAGDHINELAKRYPNCPCIVVSLVRNG